MKILIIILIIFLIGCNKPNEEATNLSADLATYNSGNISINNLNHYILSLPVNQRWPIKNTKHWLESSIKKLIVNQQLIAEAQLIGIDQQLEFLKKLNRIKRIIYSTQYIHSKSPLSVISTNVLKKYYDEHKDMFNFSEQRTVSHIYKLYNGNKERAGKEILELRRRVLKGENFSLLATQYSDSETRHNKGHIGVVKKGDLSQDFDKIIFLLKKNIPSDLVHTENGIHIFNVDNILSKKSFTFDSVRTMIRHQIEINESLNITKMLALKLPQPKELHIPDANELNHILTLEKKTIVLKVGDFSLSVDQFKQNIIEIQAKLGTIQIKDLPYITIQDIAYREIIYQYMIQNKIAVIDENKLKNQSNEILIEIMGNYKITAYLNEHPELLNKYYSKNIMRFASPVMVELDLLTIPMIKDENIMNVLEKSTDNLNDGKVTLEQVAKNHNGKVIRVSSKTKMTIF